MAHIDLTVLFDNVPGLPGLKPLWGFSALVRSEIGTERTACLVDTGSNGRILLKHMAALGVDPGTLDLVFLTHPHWDHMGGLDSLLELNPRLTVALHEGFSRHLIEDLKGLAGRVVVVGSEPLALAPGLASTGVLESEPPEQALVVDLDGALAVIGGCCHPGMERFVSRAVAHFRRPVRWAVGGFHLFKADDREIARTAAALQELGVERVLATHCTGERAVEALKRVFGPGFAAGGAGQRLVLDGPSAASQARP